MNKDTELTITLKPFVINRYIQLTGHPIIGGFFAGHTENKIGYLYIETSDFETAEKLFLKLTTPSVPDARKE